MHEEIPLLVDHDYYSIPVGRIIFAEGFDSRKLDPGEYLIGLGGYEEKDGGFILLEASIIRNRKPLTNRTPMRIYIVANSRDEATDYMALRQLSDEQAEYADTKDAANALLIEAMKRGEQAQIIDIR